MAFKRQDAPERAELTSLIDIVFLLLIFFLVAFAFSLAGDVSESKVYSELELPKTNTALPVIHDDWLKNLMIQVVPDTAGQKQARTVFVLWPTYEQSAKVTRSQALATALEDSTFASYRERDIFLGLDEFDDIPASQLIASSIDRYVADERFYRGNERPLIEVRADRNTEFRILSYIMDRCSSYDDTIPQIVIRTVP